MKKNKYIFFTVILGLLFSFDFTSAQTANRVFITSVAYDGNLGGLSGADTKCKERATTVGLSGNWKAWLSDSTTSVGLRFNKSNNPYQLINGTVVANNWTDLTDGTLNAPIMITENGSTVPTDTRVYTNTLANGNITSSNPSYNCSNWTSTPGWPNLASVGIAQHTTNSYWTIGFSYFCDFPAARLYCFEQPPTSPGLPSTPKAFPANKRISLSWATPINDGGSAITNYKIYRGTTSGGESFLANVGNVLNYTDYTVANGTTYFYKITAVNTLGEGTFSNEVSAKPTPSNYIFLTSQTYNANFGGLSGADARCQARADSVNLGGIWKAWLSDSSTAASSRLGKSNNQYLNMNGAIVANNWTDLTDGSISSPINYTENKSTVSDYVFTGTSINGGVYNQNCNNWTVADGSNSYILGYSASTNSGWTDYFGGGSRWCTNPARFYCFEQNVFEGPQNLTATPGTKITLNWQPSPAGNATGYKIYRDTSPGVSTSRSPIATIGNTLTYQDSNSLVVNTVYYYKLVAVTPAGDSDPSNEVSVRVPSVPSTPSLSITPGNGQIILNWSVSNPGGSAITGYKIYRSATSGQETFYTQTGTSYDTCCDSFYNIIHNPIPPFTDNVGTANSNHKLFYYKVSAINSDGEGPQSNEVSAMPITVPGISNITAVIDEGKVSLNWTVDNGGSPLTTAQSTAGPFTYGIDGSPSGGMIGYSNTNSATIKFSSNQLNPPSNQYFGIYAQNVAGRSAYGEIYAKPKHLSGTWTNTSGSGSTGETCNQWLTRTGQQGKSITRISRDGVSYAGGSSCTYFSGSCTGGDPNANCVGLPLGVCALLRYGTCTGGTGFVGPSDLTGNQAFDSRYGGSTGAAIRAYYGYNFYPVAGYTGSEYRVQYLQGAGPVISVNKTGSGTGTVTGTGIDCGSTCTTNYVTGDTYNFTATPNTGSVFTGWSGACSGTGSCSVVMNSNQSVTANFSLVPTITLSASPNLVAYNSTTTLSGAVNNSITSCTLSSNPAGTSRVWNTNGAFSFPSANLTSDTTFSVSCIGSGVTSSAVPVTVSVSAQTCTSWTYSAWSTCVNGQQTRTASSPLPSGCAGGTPILTQSCVVPVTVNVNTSNAIVPIHNAATISWSSTGADTCTTTKNIDGFSPTTLSTAISSAGISSGNIDYYTTFITNCRNNSGGSGSDSVVVSPVVRIIRADPDEITWEVADAISCTLKDGDGIAVASSGAERTTYSPGNIDAGITFTLECDVPGPTPFVLTAVSVLPIPKSLCTPSQLGRALGDNNIYVNRNTTWSIAPYASGTTFLGSNRLWSGTNISGIQTGTTFDKIYTTVGLKTIYATTTGILSDGITPFTSKCIATTTVKLDPGSGGEI